MTSDSTATTAQCALEHLWLRRAAAQGSMNNEAQLGSQPECNEKKERLAELGAAIRCLVEMQANHMAALTLGDRRVSRFDEEICIALESWKRTRMAYIQHLEYHGC